MSPAANRPGMVVSQLKDFSVRPAPQLVEPMNPGIHSIGSEKGSTPLLAQASKNMGSIRLLRSLSSSLIPLRSKEMGPRPALTSCVMARTRMCSMAPSPCTGSYLCIKVSPRALVKRPPRHWKRLMPQMSKSLAVAL